MKNKKGMMEFSWIFALVVGAVILFLAFYFIGTKFTEKNIRSQIETEQTLDIIFNPFSSFGSLGATSSKEIELRKPEKLNFSCDSEALGYNAILTTTESVSLRPRQVYDKYIFTENFSKGKRFQIISKPFSMPWRVSDLIYFISKENTYCFVGFNDAEKEFGSEGTGLNISNFEFKPDRGLCSLGSIKICKSSGCNITVDYSSNPARVIKNGGTSYFIDDATMYAAIFSDSVIYNCNLRRLSRRLDYQVEVYRQKAVAISGRCSAAFVLTSLEQNADDLARLGVNPTRLSDLRGSADNLKNYNMGADCKLF